MLATFRGSQMPKRENQLQLVAVGRCPSVPRIYAEVAGSDHQVPPADQHSRRRFLQGYWGPAMGDMTAVMGSRQAALDVAQEAMQRVAKTPYPSAVPGCYPVLIAIFGTLGEAHRAIEREPLLLKWYGENFLGKLGTLRRLLGKDGAQAAVRKAPYLLLEENQRKSRKFELAFEAIENLFGAQPGKGSQIRRASPHALATENVNQFEPILERTGLAEHLHWERKPRPRNGLWTPKLRMPNGFPLNHGPWSPHTNPLGKGGPARGPWKDFDEEEDAVSDEEMAEMQQDFPEVVEVESDASDHVEPATEHASSMPVGHVGRTVVL
eukprot:Skav208415  [mRNA]  locus=scaffold2953:142582:155183:+ [translate_table: standard]